MMVKIFLTEGGALEDCRVIKETASYMHVVEGETPRHLLVPWANIRFVVVLTQISKIGE
jgi:hypothetical protein